mmetsp:Transcript_10905/g.30867  ORF Transcript_10905/g.30867 Transcript_10905/m.30867 type:complete len:420 (-) Transcript_10905:147-1406(-)|eukprot:CAMPEP_0117672116 /NCGR_PEP_ID=MMETSP0804-20121206/13722_1 /TAXON_ID=1074897 /ORGANISM="Tetraselmis astigmatica, Strain CCMP880" /LENGTH=419 /DNA_ID=CAMNT_0005480675 /DNA_START=218 /DNA_END=1477 /DNA_ORIENTATION=-
MPRPPVGVQLLMAALLAAAAGAASAAGWAAESAAPNRRELLTDMQRRGSLLPPRHRARISVRAGSPKNILPRGWKEPQGGSEVPEDPSDAAAWYTDFPSCGPADRPALLELAGLGGLGKPACVQLPLPSAAARFSRNAAPAHRPIVNATKPAYLFMLGTPYSGTTALLGLLTSSPHVTIPSRGWAHEAQWMLGVEQVYSFLKKSGMDYTSGKKVNPGVMHDVNMNLDDMDRVFQGLWDANKSIKVDKSHSLVSVAPNIYQYYRAKGSVVKFIVLIRHPCTYGSRGFPTTRAMYYWHKIKRVMEDHADDVLLIQYEDFVRNPQAVADRILEFFPELESLDITVSNLDAKKTTLRSGGGDRGAATGGENNEQLVKKYVEDRMAKAGGLGPFRLDWCEGFPAARKELLPEDGLRIAEFFGWI